jgi:hypothetical protein
VQAARPRLPRKKASRTRQWLRPVTSHAGCYPSLTAALPAAAKERICSGPVSRRCLVAHHPARLDKPSEEGSKERVTSPAHHHLLQPCCISGPRGFDPEVGADVQAGERPTVALDAKEEDQGRSGSWLFLEAFPAALPMATIPAMAPSQASTVSRLMARPTALLLLLAALAAPAQARSALENRAGEKSARNPELLHSPTPQLLELQREKVTARWYDASGDSFAPSNGAKYVFDATAGRYRDATTGRFAAASDLPWPPNGGFASSARETIQPGTILDRYGSPNGRFFGEPGATVSQRGMAPGAEAMPYTKYRVLKPLDTQAGPAAGAPQFGATGGAKQYLAGNSIQWLLDNGFIEVVK